MTAFPRMLVGAGVLSISLLCQSALAGVPQVVDLAFPQPGITEVKVNWGAAYGNPVIFVGDIDGDGFHDVLAKQPDPSGSVGYTVLVYGQAAPPAIATFDSLRKTYLLHGDADTGIYPADDVPYAPAGDLDGDGHGDFFFSASSADWNGSVDSGVVLLVFGSAGFPPEVDLAAPERSGTRVIRFLPQGPEYHTGTTVRTVGDLNDDGRQDIAISAQGAPREAGGAPFAGRVYVIFGGWDFTQDVRLAGVGHEVPGFIVRGIDGQSPGVIGDILGWTLSGAGDLDGDGFDDLLVGAPFRNKQQGEAYVIYGGEDLPADVDLAVAGSWGVTVHGPAGIVHFGDGLVGTGDLNGDGLADFLTTADAADWPRGRAYIVHGSSSWGQVLFVEEPGFDGVRMVGRELPSFPYSRGNFGASTAAVGDWNGDEHSDLVVGAPGVPEGFEPYVGNAYLVFGSDALPSDMVASEVGFSVPGIVFRGPRSLANLGLQAFSGGDFTGDGKQDLIVTAPYFSPYLPVEDSSFFIISGGFSSQDLKIFAVEPAGGSVEGGTEIRLRGSGFDDGIQVRFDGVLAPEVSVLTSADLLVRLPSRVAPGPVNVEVRLAVRSAELPLGFEYTPRTAFGDITLDDPTLSAGPYRTLVVRGIPEPARGARQIRNFLLTLMGDLDADGTDDLLIGAPYHGSEWQGTVAIVFGGASLPPVIERAELEEYATVIEGEEEAGTFGYFLALPGDVNGDGYPDLAVGGTLHEGSRGSSYLILGVPEWPRGRVSLPALLANGEAIAWDNVGCERASLSGPGDVTGDGLPDLVLGNTGCPGARGVLDLHGVRPGDPFPGPAPLFEVTGDPTPVPDLLGDDRPMLRTFAYALSGAGDMNGDHRLDVLVGASHPVGQGEAYLLFDFPDDGGVESINKILERGQGVRVRRQQLLGHLGEHLAPAGDFNGDGLADALIGVTGGGRTFQGETFLVFGSSDLGKTIREIDLLQPGPWGIRFHGEFPYDWSGSGLAGLGDLNGDGYHDVGIMGGDLWNPDSTAHVVFGGPSTPLEVRLDDLRDRGFRIRGADETSWFSAGLQGGMAAGDLDGDGARDLAIAERTLDGYRAVVLFGRGGPTRFLRGDADADGATTLTDAIVTVGYLFLGTDEPACLDAADSDDSGGVEITDAIYLLGVLFLGQNTFPPPIGGCGPDPTEDLLRCRQTCFGAGQ